MQNCLLATMSAWTNDDQDLWSRQASGEVPIIPGQEFCVTSQTKDIFLFRNIRTVPTSGIYN